MKGQVIDMSNGGNHGHDGCDFCGGTGGYHVDEYHGYSSSGSGGRHSGVGLVIIVLMLFVLQFISKFWAGAELLAIIALPAYFFIRLML